MPVSTGERKVAAGSRVLGHSSVWAPRHISEGRDPCVLAKGKGVQASQS